MAALRTSVPAPLFVKPPVPVMRLPMVVVLPATLIVGVVPLKEMVPPVNVGDPSSTVMPEVVWVPATVTANALVASVPALKTAALPEVHVVVAVVPAVLAVQSVAAPDQVPVGVAPAPAVAPFVSQYRVCPRSAVVPHVATMSSEANKRAGLIAPRSFMNCILKWFLAPLLPGGTGSRPACN